MTNFNVSLRADYSLSVRDVWPDGDVPDNPTPEMVAEQMREYGDQYSTLREWNLLERLSVDVDGVEVWPL